MPIIKRKTYIGSVIHTDCWKSYDVLIVDGYKHYRIRHSEAKNIENIKNAIDYFNSLKISNIDKKEYTLLSPYKERVFYPNKKRLE